MKKITSIGISRGFALAPIKILSDLIVNAEKDIFTTAENEWKLFKAAQAQAIEELNNLAQKAEKDAGADFATLFETHALMAEDPDFEDAVQEGVEQSLLTAHSAVLQAGETLAQFFESMDDEYMRQRSADVKDVAGRIASIIRGGNADAMSFDSPVIIVADDLTPSQTIQLDKEYVKGFILYNGTPNGHTGILARNLGIPAVIKPDEHFCDSDNGKIVFLDGKSGEIIFEPDTETEQKCNERIEKYFDEQKELLKYKDAKTITSDGRSVKLYCNIGKPSDAKDVIDNGGEGVGLFRSEFLYLSSADYPDEEEQFKAYSEVLKVLNGKEVIIRTCDIGSDKRIDYFELPEEQNPALGTRAIRICLDRKDMFKSQLRALYRASVFGKLSIMFPMIASVWELEEAKAVIEEVKSELRNENKPFDDRVKVGIMIETPAAAVISDELAKISDFFSIGSNDLTQYTLACDRNSQLGRYFNPKHPAVLRLIELVAQNAHKASIPVGICGELAADEDLTEFFLDIGIDELSVSPKKIMQLRKRINNL